MAQTRKSAKPRKATVNKSTSPVAAVKKTVKKATKLPKAPPARPPVEQGAEEPPVVGMIRGLAAIADTHSLTELIYDTPDLTVTLRRGGVSLPVAVSASAPVSQVAIAPAAAISAPAPVPAPAQVAVPAAAAAPVADEENLHAVTSPFVGTFYRRPSPDAQPYVEVGQKVDKGQVLCIIEAMKLMNEIESDMAGVLAAVSVDDSSSVEYGQPLFKIRPA